MTPRICLPALASPQSPHLADDNSPIPLEDTAAHHLIRVLRRAPGDTVEVFDGQGRHWLARLHTVRPATVILQTELPAEPPARLQLGLAQCLSTAEKMDWTIEKAVELGVTQIIPLLSERSVVRLEGTRADKRLQHWQRLITAAAMQSGRNRLPELAPIQSVNDWLARLPPCRAGERRWLLSPLASAPLVTQVAEAPATHTAWLLCGPESGLSEAEQSRAMSAGWHPALLGPRILRTETAGLVALSILQAGLGDLGLMPPGPSGSGHD